MALHQLGQHLHGSRTERWRVTQWHTALQTMALATTIHSLAQSSIRLPLCCWLQDPPDQQDLPDQQDPSHLQDLPVLADLLHH